MRLGLWLQTLRIVPSATVQVWDEPIELRLPPPLPDEQPLQVAPNGSGRPAVASAVLIRHHGWRKGCSVIVQPVIMQPAAGGRTQFHPHASPTPLCHQIRAKIMSRIRLFPDRLIAGGTLLLTDLYYGGGQHEVRQLAAHQVAQPTECSFGVQPLGTDYAGLPLRS